MKLSLIVTAAALAATGCTQTDHDSNSGAASSEASSCSTMAPPVDVSTGYAPVNGLLEYYEVHGKGAPLVMLPGAFCTIAFCDSKLIAALETSRQVIAVEPQGMGHTADVDRPFSYEQLADDTVAVMQYLHIDTADVFGFSIGGAIAQQMAIRHPEVVHKLIDASAPFKSDGWYPQVIAGEQAITPQLLEQSPFYSAYLQVAPRPQDWPTFVQKEKALALTVYDWTTDVAAIKSPIMVVIGDSDSVQPQAALDFFKLVGGGVPGDFQPLPSARFTVLPATAHSWVMLSDLLPLTISPFLDATADGYHSAA